MKPIPGFPNYFITKDGRIWSIPRKNSLGRKRRGFWLKHAINNHGYCNVVLTVDSCRHTCSVHRLVLETYVGPCPEGMECRHLDGIRTANRLDNLCWGTRSENAFDTIRHGTRVDTQGEKCGMSKLTNYKIKVIRYLRNVAKFSLKDIAWQFDVDPSTICKIIKGKTWGHV
ncbi:hypothetical protein LCGC14_0579140 [marine sediment metagenome]|uniref:HNH nuclease domain-containing protein n=1 Tax=marine sediment metagenome TaxID=412755 RepID=A0A0F9RH29_9ZZZZ